MTQELLDFVSTLAVLVGVWKLDSINKTLGALSKGLELMEGEVGRMRDRMHELSNWIFTAQAKQENKKKVNDGTEQRSATKRSSRRKAS